MACKLLTDTAIKIISNNYPCQVVLDKGVHGGGEPPGARGAPPINRIEAPMT